MGRIIKFFAIWILSSLAVYANEIVNVRFSAFAEKTRLVFDLKEKPNYSVQITDPYQVILHFDKVDSVPLKYVPGKSLGKVIESVTPIAIGGGVSYVFNLRYAVKPVHAQLAPQGNYRSYRVYIDFLNNQISGNPRDPAHKLSMPRITPENTPKPNSSAAVAVRETPKNNKADQDKIDSIRVLTPEEAEKKRVEMQKANETSIAYYDQKNNSHSKHEKISSETSRSDVKVNTKPIEKKQDGRTDMNLNTKPADHKQDSRTDKPNARPSDLRTEPKQNMKPADQKRDVKRDEPKSEVKQETHKPDVKTSTTASVTRDVKEHNAVNAGQQVNTKPNGGKNEKQINTAASKPEPVREHQASSKQDNKKTSNACKTSAKIVIAIDPGHGGKDPGAIGAKKNKEKTVTLAIAKQLQILINKTPGMKAVMTRSSDIFIDLDNRSEIARKNNADLLISIHADAATNSSASGASVLVLNNDRAGRENRKMLNTKQKHDQLLGGASDVLEETALIGENDSYMQNMIIDLTSDKSRDAGYDLANKIIAELSKFAAMHKKRPEERSLAVLKAPDIPSVLVESGFISNASEEAKLKTADYQKKIARAIYNALISHLNHPKYQLSPDRHCKKR